MDPTKPPPPPPPSDQDTYGCTMKGKVSLDCVSPPVSADPPGNPPTGSTSTSPPAWPEIRAGGPRSS